MSLSMRLLSAFLSLAAGADAQTLWDGGGGDSLWLNPLNWSPDGVPATGADVLLDHSILKTGYQVVLPSGNAGVSLSRLRVLPEGDSVIRLLLPRSNTAAPALRLTGSGDCLVLGQGSTFTNSSGAGSGDPVAFSGGMRIENGATYVHNTARGNARVVERLSAAAGTEEGVFVFDVPGASAYALSLSGRTFGRLVLKSTAAGTAKRYSGSGSNPLTVRGGLVVEKGAALTATLTGDIRMGRGMQVDGSLTLAPSTTGTSDRSLILSGEDTALFSGTGTVTLSTHFRNIVADSGSVVALQRDLELPSPGHSFIVERNATLVMGESLLTGLGTFANEPRSTLCIGSSDGLRQTGGLGNIRTSVCRIDSAAAFVYTRDGPQSTGDGLPRRIRVLKTQKPSGPLSLSQGTEVYEELHLVAGRLLSRPSAMLTLSGKGLYSPPNSYGERDAGWELGFVDGPMRRVASDTTPIVFPVGSDSAFAPIRLRRMHPGIIAYTVQYHPRPYAHLEPVANPPLGQVSRYEHWELHAEGPATDPSYLLSLSWRSAHGSREGWRDSLRIAQYENRGVRLQWEMAGEKPLVTGVGDRGYVACDRPLGSHGVFTLASASPFAVLDAPPAGLQALPGNGGVLLRWTCASPSSCEGCRLQRSGGGQDFAVIHERTASGPSGPAAREHMDREPLQGRNLYRVSCGMWNGDRRESDVASVFWKPVIRLKVHPNPTSGILHAEGFDGAGPASVIVRDAWGRTVWSAENVDVLHVRIDLTALRPGVYTLQWLNGREVRLASFIRR